jgi:hypothetical protein
MNTLVLLERLHLPQRARRYLLYELSVGWKSSYPLGVDGLLRQQGAALRAAWLVASSHSGSNSVAQ